MGRRLSFFGFAFLILGIAIRGVCLFGQLALLFFFFLLFLCQFFLAFLEFIIGLCQKFPSVKNAFRP